MPPSVLLVELGPLCFGQLGLAYTQDKQERAGEVVVTAEAILVVPENLKDMMKLLDGEGTITAFLDAAGIVDVEGRCRVVGEQTQLDGVIE